MFLTMTHLIFELLHEAGVLVLSAHDAHALHPISQGRLICGGVRLGRRRLLWRLERVRRQRTRLPLRREAGLGAAAAAPAAAAVG